MKDAVPAPIRVLYVQPDPREADRVRRHLLAHNPPIAVETARRPKECLDRLKAEPFDALLVAARNPLTLLDRLQAIPARPPVVLLVAPAGEAVAVRGLRRGAHDYLVRRRGYLTQLPLTLEAAVLHHRLQAEREKLTAQVSEAARVHEQTLQTEKLAALGQVIARLAHELSNPLVAILGTAELLRREPLPPETLERVGRITQQAERMARLVRNLLSFTRQRPPDRRQPVDLNQLLQETLGLEAFELQRSRITVARELAGELPETLADPDQLQQVFTNLIRNAAQAMRAAHGRGTLTVTTRSDEAAGRVVAQIADDGPGIPPEHLPRIFDPFFTSKREGEGTGLGLAIARGIVEAHGGTIGVTSRPGAGATFTVELPVQQERRRKARSEDEGPAILEKAVLVVEHDAATAALLGELLGLDRHRVERVGSGGEALRRLMAGTYDVIVANFRLPDRAGVRLYRELDAMDPALPDRLIFLLEEPIDPETRTFLERTRLVWLVKPFTLAELQRAIRRVVLA